MSFSKMYFSSQPGWEETNSLPFNELILSWNGIRPQKGKWTFWISLHEGEWLKYAEWAPDSQRSFHSVGVFAESYQDAVIPKELCTAFRVKVEGKELDSLHRLNVCVSNLANHSLRVPQNLSPVLLKDVPRQSQLVLNHPRRKDLCSPTSTTTAIRYLLQSNQLDPRDFASRIHDEGFDIYGNWILNIAEAYNQLRAPCHVERLNDFTALHAKLMQSKPVVVSVKGSIPGAPKPYPAGHLICVIGYEKNQVYCIDSAFPDNASTFVGYDLNDFLTAWGTRRNLAYVF